MIMIRLSNITKTYTMGETSQDVLKKVSLSIETGELVAIMGASGSGKSTLMNIIGLLDRPSQGQYLLQERDVSSLSDDDLAELRNKNFGFVFQQFFLLPRMTATQNVSLPLHYRGTDKWTINDKVADMLSRVGMSDRVQHRPSELSGGQQQRVAIARALIGDPAVILADEPTGALDSKTGQEVMTLFKELNAREGKTIIIVTHDPKVAEQCQRTVHLSDGKVVSG